MNKYHLFINGSICASKEEKYFDCVNPSDGKVFAQVADAASEDMRMAISAARKAFDSGIWSGLTVEQRGRYLEKISKLVLDNAKELADIETKDTGKTGKQTTFIDVPTAAATFEYFSKAKSWLDGEQNEIPAPVLSTTAREPIGVVGCIIPWNYPLIMFAWKVAPALMAGNTVVFRPSSTASASIMKLAQWIHAADLPQGVLNIVSTSRHDVVDQLIESPDVDMISFTGGTETGKKIMRQAAQTAKKCTMELGGKSPNIVFADCDIDAAVGGTMSAIFMNQGQMCTAGARLLVEESIYPEFIEELVARTKKLTIGPAGDYATDFGPVISQKQKDNILRYVKKGIEEGAVLACGGKIPDAVMSLNGFYVEPAIFTGVRNDMTIAREEIFGPVLCVMKFKDEEEAVKSANDTEYGLAACVWTKDIDKARRVAGKIRCGTVWVNTYGGFYNEAPFGGCKQSGFGRELGKDGLLEYTQTKHICIDQTPGGRPLVSGWF